MKRNSFNYSAAFWLLFAVLLIPLNVKAQEGEYSINIKQPALDTIFRCPGDNIIFIAEGLNADGSAFDPNQVVFTWTFGSAENTVAGSTVTHSFDDGGHYLVSLSAVSLNGNPALNIPEIHVFIGMSPYFTGTRSNKSSICSGEEITLTGFVTPRPWTGDSFEFENTFDQATYIWSGALIQYNRNGIARAKPPLDEGHKEYIFRVQDDFGCFHDTSLILKGLYAEYSFKPVSGEAPLEVEFKPEKVDAGGTTTGINYLWEFYERSDPTNIFSSIEGTYVFERPGDYVTWMTASFDQCTYRFELTNMLVHVDSSLLEVPNVFTPNDDGINDFFQVKSVSLKSFSGKIFNRWGKLVYEWTDWKTPEAGWNGQNQNTGGKSPEGTYFYVIEARGWDWDYLTEDYKEYKDTKKDKENRLYTGFITLLR